MSTARGGIYCTISRMQLWVHFCDTSSKPIWSQERDNISVIRLCVLYLKKCQERGKLCKQKNLCMNRQPYVQSAESKGTLETPRGYGRVVVDEGLLLVKQNQQEFLKVPWCDGFWGRITLVKWSEAISKACLEPNLYAIQVPREGATGKFTCSFERDLEYGQKGLRKRRCLTYLRLP